MTAAGGARRPPRAVRRDGSAMQRANHSLETGRERQQLARGIRPEGADRLGEIDGANQLVKRVVRNVEVAPADAGRVARQPLAEPEKRALGSPSRLIAKLGVTDVRLVNATSELLRDLVRVESLERQK